LQESRKHDNTVVKGLEAPPVLIELEIKPNQSFFDVLLESIDDAFLTLGEATRMSIYLYFENNWGLKKQEIPFRLGDFQNALEQLFGVGARNLEILFIKKLHDKLKTTYKWDMPSWVVPELTFKEYINLVTADFEKSNKTNKPIDGGASDE
jgi:hypothetical protein